MEIARLLQNRIIQLLSISPDKFDLIMDLQMEQMGTDDRAQALESLVVGLLYRYEDPQLDYLWFSMKRGRPEAMAA
ncbi:MAG: hypothetical protein A2X86_22050 [Bdellovibrionales bacterium GWA2_49_15]|nr:MAG: hypothetical protein A2X86_22050 [Bdellovibrionales bacterium GWA2_49_15]HAZ15018.1 hypothetical protein [Bdellovibrionales bacterium]